METFHADFRIHRSWNDSRPLRRLYGRLFYIERGKVFANAQTGNMLLFGVNLSEGNYQTMLNYLFPVLAFTGNRTGRHGPYKRTEPASLETDFCPYRNPDPDCSQFLSYDAQSACQLAYLFCLWHSG